MLSLKDFQLDGMIQRNLRVDDEDYDDDDDVDECT